MFFFKQKTAYEIRISDWSSDVCSSDLRSALLVLGLAEHHLALPVAHWPVAAPVGQHLQAALHGRPRVDLVHPALQVRVLLDVMALVLPRPDPGAGRHVGAGVFVAA